MAHTSVSTYEDAQLILKLYELRREEKMRAAREWFTRRFFPQTFEEVRAALAPTSSENPYLRMIFGYWDMAASFVTHGVLNAELFLESGGEMLFVWAKIQPFIRELRAEFGPALLVNVEKTIAQVPAAGERIKGVKERIGRMARSLAASGKS